MKPARLADRLIQLDRTDRIARLVIGVRALKQKQYGWPGRTSPNRCAARLPISRQRCCRRGRSQARATRRGATDTLDGSPARTGMRIFKDLHAGLILDVANNKKEAGKRYERAYKADPMALRTVQAYGRFLSRNGSKDDALKIYQEFNKAVPEPSGDRRKR